jgi:hypothetical protein
LALLWLLVASVPAWANAGPPPRPSPGTIVGEPIGIQDVAISRETLVIDLRPLATKSGLAEVEAVYHLDNHGAIQKLELLFASGSKQATGFQAWLDDQSVACTPLKDAKLPASWTPPKYTPGFGDQQELNYPSRGAIPVSFSIVVPSGPHTLRVHYVSAAAIQYPDRYPTVLRQFAYVLAPARAWKEFGGLDVTVYLPKNWRAACTPPLRRADDTLTGSFADVPADAIALTVQASGTTSRVLLFAGLGLFGLAVLGGAVLCWWGGRSKGRRLAAAAEPPRNWRQRHAWPTSVAWSVAWGFAALTTGLFAFLAPVWVLPADQMSHDSYELVPVVFGLFFLSAWIVPLGFAIAQVTALVTHHRRH